MNKNLEYYLNLPYTIEVKPIHDEMGGGYMATLPELGKFAIIGDGETIQEAIGDLTASKERVFSGFIEEGINIPEPRNTEDYSGKFFVRVPRSLHRDLSKNAKDEGVSLNQYVSYLLSTAFERSYIIAEMKEHFHCLTQQIKSFSYEIAYATQTTPQRQVRYSLGEYEKAA